MDITCNAFVIKHIKGRKYRTFVCGKKAVYHALVTDERYTPRTVTQTRCKKHAP
jgi:hypothetical protein